MRFRFPAGLCEREPEHGNRLLVATGQVAGFPEVVDRIRVACGIGVQPAQRKMRDPESGMRAQHALQLLPRFVVMPCVSYEACFECHV